MGGGIVMGRVRVWFDLLAPPINPKLHPERGSWTSRSTHGSAVKALKQKSPEFSFPSYHCAEPTEDLFLLRNNVVVPIYIYDYGTDYTRTRLILPLIT